MLEGLVPVTGHLHSATIEDLSEMVTIGPICRYAEDLELALNVLSKNRLHRNAFILTVGSEEMRLIRVQS